MHVGVVSRSIVRRGMSPSRFGADVIGGLHNYDVVNSLVLTNNIEMNYLLI